MTSNAIAHYFADFPTWLAIHGNMEPSLDAVYDWAASLVEDNFISEEEAAQLGAAASKNPELYNKSLEGNAPGAKESAATLGVAPAIPLKASVEKFADAARAAVKAIYDTNSVMLEDCDGDILALNGAIEGLRTCVEKASISLYMMGKAMSYQKNEDTMKALSLLGDAIKELAGGDASGNSEEEAGAPEDSLSSEVSALYNEEPTAPDALPNPAEAEPEA